MAYKGDRGGFGPQERMISYGSTERGVPRGPSERAIPIGTPMERTQLQVDGARVRDSLRVDGVRLIERDFTVERARLASRGESAPRSFSSEGITARLFGVSNRDLSRGKAGSEAAGVIRQAMAFEYLYALCGLGLGFAAILSGTALCLHGVAGSSSWTASLLGLSSAVNDAPPGVMLFIIGVFFVRCTKPNVKLRDIRDQNR